MHRVRHPTACKWFSRPVIDHEFRHNIVKVAVDLRGDSRVDPQTTLTPTILHAGVYETNVRTFKKENQFSLKFELSLTRGQSMLHTLLVEIVIVSTIRNFTAIQIRNENAATNVLFLVRTLRLLNDN